MDCDCKKFRPMTGEISKERDKKAREAREFEEGKNKARRQSKDLLEWAEKMKKADEAEKVRQIEYMKQSEIRQKKRVDLYKQERRFRNRLEGLTDKLYPSLPTPLHL